MATGVRGIVTCPVKSPVPVVTKLPVTVSIVAPAFCATIESPNHPPGPSAHLVNTSVVPVPLPDPVTYAAILANVTLFVELLLLVSEINNKSLPCKADKAG